MQAVLMWHIDKATRTEILAWCEKIGAKDAASFIHSAKENCRTFGHGVASNLLKQFSQEDLIRLVKENFGWTIAVLNEKTQKPAEDLLRAVKDSKHPAVVFLQENDPGMWAKFQEICEQQVCEGTRIGWALQVLATNEGLEALL